MLVIQNFSAVDLNLFAPEASEIRLFFPHPPPDLDLLTLGIKLRGGIGQRLFIWACQPAKEKHACQHPYPCAQQIWKNALRGSTAGNKINPITMRCLPNPTGVEMQIRLFGEGQSITQQVLAAAVEHSQNGAEFTNNRGQARSWRLQSWTIEKEKFTPLPTHNAAMMRFLSPWRNKSGNHHQFSERAIFTGMANRLGAIASWHNQSLKLDMPRLLREMDQIILVDSEPVDIGWKRRPRNSRTLIHEGGTGGDFVFAGLSPTWFRIMDIGAFCQIGAETSAGFGHYQLLLPHNL